MIQKQDFKITDNIGVEQYNSFGTLSLIAKSEISYKQKQIAQNYLVIKKIYGVFSIPAKITNVETRLLEKYGFETLENTTAEKMIQELNKLRLWSNSYDEILSKHSDMIFEIRVKELKYLYASNYFPQNELNEGWKILERYIDFIGK